MPFVVPGNVNKLKLGRRAIVIGSTTPGRHPIANLKRCSKQDRRT